MKWTWLGSTGEGVKHDQRRVLAVQAVTNRPSFRRHGETRFDSVGEVRSTVDDHS
jgi:hypothetical protein